MSIHAALHHVTHYRYDRPVQLGPQVVRLRPAPHCRSRIISYSLKIEPAQHFINWQQDPFANWQARLVFPDKTTEFKVTVDLVAEMAVYNPFDFFLEPAAEQFPFDYDPLLKEELAPYLARAPQGDLFNHYVAGIDRSPQRTIDFLVGLNQRLQHDIGYLIRLEPGVQTPEQTLHKASGSCRDSGWLLVQLLRHCGLAARFVSGYLIQLKADQKSLDGPSGTEVDFTDLHAWAEVYLPGAGWVGLDPTSGLLAGEGHIPLACTPQPSGAAPIEGLVDDARVEFRHDMAVTRIHESPRVTLPYSDAQWADILQLGDAVDLQLQADDVRLTMGGEPTFVGIDDRDGPEWNTAALGPTKRVFALDLLHRLKARYGPNGLLHLGQGKWYPGEQLPRWALSLFWRPDGQPLWRNPALQADERQPQQARPEDAERFIRALAERLGVGTATIAPAYEDAWHYIAAERRLPINVDPFDSRLADEAERARLRRVFTQGLDKVVGWLLPLRSTSELAHAPDRPAQPAGAERPRWLTSRWWFRDNRLVLVPGDSPMGFRLPLNSLPWVADEDLPKAFPKDPYADDADNDALAAAEDEPSGAHDPEDREPRRHESARWVPRTALCVEVRDPVRSHTADAELPEIEGDDEAADAKRAARSAHQAAVEKYALKPGQSSIVYIFMPPLDEVDDYLALVTAIEATAEQLQLPVVLEGYPPPRDKRLKMLQITPDPGVIEANIQPVHHWRELVDNTEFLYQSAFESRLSAEKFMVDGRHTGTGGGNHFVLGGATPADSPFLRRPDLLASLLLYWHNHPSLSYLFSGLFIGPTSQAPRVDEARNDQLYELEIALQEIHRASEEQGDAMPPWLVDRTLRNILIDVTGNTHRSEFCIDKLYSPEGPTGRLGLLELRAFEMPPHARMSIAQKLLMRALVARFWRQPYRAPATRWGTQLHDRFMLPAWVQADFADVMRDMREAGFAFDDAWFAPHFEFRFPIVGDVQLLGMQLELRNALEPWHVMGEESAGGATARYVDSSLERLQLRVTGFNDSRYALTCNGQALPLQPLGTEGEYACGVRFKAWNPWSALHPTIQPHGPLVFDVFDTWNGRSVGGCRYHVAHPGGRSYDSFPINAYEAESRRLARFAPMGHTAGRAAAPPAALALPGSREFPCTLDLRRTTAVRMRQ
ncbi:MAG: transglutaminase family protein [Ottowia sp.]|nr:transglutaminase family protein [Ottowia sp.]MBP7535677.1 transglutaminase family protein [Ottowia sp.]